MQRLVAHTLLILTNQQTEVQRRAGDPALAGEMEIEEVNNPWQMQGFLPNGRLELRRK